MPAGPGYHWGMRTSAALLLALINSNCALAQTTPGAPDPLHVGPVTQFEDHTISESSGVAASRQFAGVLWTHNDGGNAPYLFATDTLARTLGTWIVAGSDNRDWEDIAAGPCPDGGHCLYLGDVGDNRERRSTDRIYRFREPDPDSVPSDSIGETPASAVLTFQYPDGPTDVEAMYVDTNGDVYLISKGGSGPVMHYRLRTGDWARGIDHVVTAEALGQFPIDPGTTRLAGVTGSDLSADGHRLVVRTYRELFFYAVDETGAVGDGPVTTCPILGLESQGEGVAWLDDQRVVLTSERGVLGRGTVAVVRCQLPWSQ